MLTFSRPSERDSPPQYAQPSAHPPDVCSVRRTCPPDDLPRDSGAFRERTTPSRLPSIASSAPRDSLALDFL